jgi:oligopeptide transport system ATP-binding protein
VSEDGPILTVENLSVVFHTYAGAVQAVRDVSFTLGKGEVLAIVGESGSGKSVTAQAIIGLTPIPPGEITGGRVRYRQTDMIRASVDELAGVRGAGISMIFQDPMTSLNPSMQVGRQIREVLHRHHRLTADQGRARAIELLQLVGIPEPRSRLVQYPHQFSGGMRQRIMIAIAIANNPDILLADEPTTALDVTIQSQIFRLIRDIQKQFGTAMILITHDLGLVAGTAHRIAVMYGGRIVEEGATDQIYYDPQHPYTLGLLKAVPKLTDNSSAPLRTIEGLPPLLIDPPDACAFADRCPFVMRICRQKDPGYFTPVASNRVACWLHHGDAAAQRATFEEAKRSAAEVAVTA